MEALLRSISSTTVQSTGLEPTPMVILKPPVFAYWQTLIRTHTRTNKDHKQSRSGYSLQVITLKNWANPMGRKRNSDETATFAVRQIPIPSVRNRPWWLQLTWLSGSCLAISSLSSLLPVLQVGPIRLSCRLLLSSLSWVSSEDCFQISTSSSSGDQHGSESTYFMIWFISAVFDVQIRAKDRQAKELAISHWVFGHWAYQETFSWNCQIYRPRI